MSNHDRSRRIREIVLIAMLTATLTGGKLALSFLPNIEIVTLLLIAYSFVFGLRVGLPCSILFVIIESFLYGFNTWTISYFLYWPLLSFMACIVANLKKSKALGVLSLTVLITFFFGVLTSAVDAVIGTINTSFSFSALFFIIYLRGIAFFSIHIISNLILSLVCFSPLSKILNKLRLQYFDITIKN